MLKWQRLERTLRRGIGDGTWPPGSQLPTEAELSAEHGLSLNTVRRALDQLVEHGLIVRRQGAGTFVTGTTRARPPSKGRLGVLLPELNYYFEPVVRGIEDAAAAAGRRVLLHESGYHEGAEQRAIEALTGLLADGVDGLLLTPPRPMAPVSAQLRAMLRDLPVPAVFLERRFDPSGASDRTEHVYTDQAGGAYDAVAHLHRLGHKDFALVRRLDAGPTRGIAEGFDQAARDFGLHVTARFDWPWDPFSMHGWDETRPTPADAVFAELWRGRPTALLCFGDIEARQLITAGHRAGVRIPADLALVSYDDSHHAPLAAVPLTSIAPEKYRMGAMAMDILLRRLADPHAELRQVRLRPRLVVRRSCGATNT